MSIDLASLAPPNVVEPLDYEQYLAALVGKIIAYAPVDLQEQLRATLALESEPLTITSQAYAYREVLIRNRVNDAARALMLAYAEGADLEHLGALYDTPRLAGENDTRYRSRIQQSYHRLAAAGPANAYKQHALSVSADIVDVDVWSEAPGQVTVAVLARAETSTASLDEEALLVSEALFGPPPSPQTAWAPAATDSLILRQVQAALNAQDVRPLTDHVIVRAALIVPYQIHGVLEVLPGPDATLIKSRRISALKTHAATLARMRHDITLTGIIAAATEPGVKDVRISRPLANIPIGNGALAVCTRIDIHTEAVDA